MIEQQEQLFKVMARVPPMTAPDCLLDLNLEATGLSDVDVSAYVSLQRLKYGFDCLLGYCFIGYEHLSSSSPRTGTVTCCL